MSNSMFLSDCIRKDPSVCELFIVQPSLAELVRYSRNRVTQAVLPMDASILGTTRLRLDVMLDNEAARSLIAVLGVGIYDVLEVDRLRYGKIILVFDSANENRSIEHEILRFFRKYMPPFLPNGLIYLCAPGDVTSLEEAEAKMMNPLTRQIRCVKRVVKAKLG